MPYRAQFGQLGAVWLGSELSTIPGNRGINAKDGTQYYGPSHFSDVPLMRSGLLLYHGRSPR